MFTILEHMITVDARGFSCPQPMIMTKRAMKLEAPGTEFTVILGSQNACNNITTYLTDLKTEIKKTVEGTDIILTFKSPVLK